MKIKVNKEIELIVEFKEDIMTIKIVKNTRVWENVFTNAFIQKMSAKCGEWMDIDELAFIMDKSRYQSNMIQILKFKDKYKVVQGSSLASVATLHFDKEEKLILVLRHRHKDIYYPFQLKAMAMTDKQHHIVPKSTNDLFRDIQLNFQKMKSTSTLGNTDLDSIIKSSQILLSAVQDQMEATLLENEKSISKVQKQNKHLINQVNVLTSQLQLTSSRPTRQFIKTKSRSKSRSSSLSIPRENKSSLLRYNYIHSRQSSQSSKSLDSKFNKPTTKKKFDKFDKFEDQQWWERLSKKAYNDDPPLMTKISKLQAYLKKLKQL